MLRYEFIRCMDLRSKLMERIKGQIYVGMFNDVLTISIFGCPTCRYKVEVNENIMSTNIDDMANRIYYDYRKFIDDRFFI